jgi:hypothetical protein
MTPKQTTADLIRQLAASPAPRPFRTGVVAGGLLALLGISLGAFWLVFGIRTDLASAWLLMQVQAKTVLPLFLAIMAIWLAFGSSRPGGRIVLWPLAVPLLLGVFLVIQRFGQVAEGSLQAEALGQTAFACLASITVLSATPLGVGIVMLRRGAAIRPALTGTLLGIAVGAGVTAGYALHCTEDSPLFFVLWYGLAIAIVAGCGGVLGHRYLRW